MMKAGQLGPAFLNPHVSNNLTNRVHLICLRPDIH
jgi:hypothetical protein